VNKTLYLNKTNSKDILNRFKGDKFMKALVYDGYKDVHVNNVPDPSIEKSDDIIVKITSTAIAGTASTDIGANVIILIQMARLAVFSVTVIPMAVMMEVRQNIFVCLMLMLALK
jgi:hypothetical protein